MRVEVIIYVYLYICVSMIFFNIFYLAYKKQNVRNLYKRSNRLRDIIYQQIERMEKREPISTQLQEKLAKKLKKLHHLYAFHDAVDRLIKEDNPFILDYINTCRPIFVYIATVYGNKNHMKKAYFAYLMSRYKMSKFREDDTITDIMIAFVNEESVYCRENALRALYSFGNEKHVVRAYMQLTLRNISHSSKLITDGLLSFEGNHIKLSKLLWERFDEMDLELQVGIINYIKMISKAYCKSFYDRLVNPKTNMEIKLAIIRYFHKYYYEPAREILIGFVKYEEKFEWEIVAVAAFALQNYPGNDTVYHLSLAIFSRNWYIRFNAAESLKALQVERNELEMIYNCEDQYAIDMLQYGMESYQLKREA